MVLVAASFSLRKKPFGQGKRRLKPAATEKLSPNNLGLAK
jgi:hypothetical protein